MSDHSAKPDVYEQITQAVVAAIEEGTQTFQMPWHSLSIPVNATNQKPYRGVNVLMLWAAAQKHAYSSNEWATYNQWQQAGAQVRRTQRSAPVVFWKFYGQFAEEQRPEETESTPDRPRCLARCYSVFNADQVDGYTSRIHELLSEEARIENADRFFASLPGTVKHGGDRAFYSPTEDFIQIPLFTQFKSAQGYVSTLGHEYAHWSGARSRLNRDLTPRFGTEQYAIEELVAELAASFLSADLHIQSEPRTDHAPYCASWLRVLRNDKRAIFTAASKAQESTAYLQQLAGFAQECAS